MIPSICLGGNSQFLFHGTPECSVYSIMRNGISAMNRPGVWMTSDINTALGYATTLNKVFLVFEAQTRPEDIRGANFIYEIPESRISLRAIMWIHNKSVKSIQELSAKVVNHLKSN